MHREPELLFVPEQRLELLSDDVVIIVAQNILLVLSIVVKAEVTYHDCIRLTFEQLVEHILKLSLAIAYVLKLIQ